MPMTIDELKARVRTIVVVLMENRSFDHVFGHMSLPGDGQRTDVDGIPDPTDPALANVSANGTMISPFATGDAPFPGDLPHERPEVAIQFALAPAIGSFAMNGFVKAYEGWTNTSGTLTPPPMGFLSQGAAPVSRFFADHYALCQRWFAPLPASTQPNRLMAISGYATQDVTKSGLLPRQDTVLDWLLKHGVHWRVYSAGLSFFALMEHHWPLLLTDHFRRLPSLLTDVLNESDNTWPEVIFIEPDYDVSPVHLSGHACDNHPPLPMAFGESFLRQVYESLTANPERWGRTVMIYTYDEHGGFFDHVQPLPVPSPPPPGATYTEGFTSTGVRVPAVVISPMVEEGSVVDAQLDHTSILQLIAERFGSGPYSAAVDARRAAGIQSVSVVLDASVDRPTIPVVPNVALSATASLQTWRDPKTEMQQAFVAATEGLAKQHGAAALDRIPEIAHWIIP